MNSSTYTLGECLRILGLTFLVGLVASAGTYFIQFSTGWTYWMGWTLTVVFGLYYLALSGAFIFDILRNEYRIRFESR